MARTRSTSTRPRRSVSDGSFAKAASKLASASLTRSSSSSACPRPTSAGTYAASDCSALSKCVGGFLRALSRQGRVAQRRLGRKERGLLLERRAEFPLRAPGVIHLQVLPAARRAGPPSPAGVPSGAVGNRKSGCFGAPPATGAGALVAQAAGEQGAGKQRAAGNEQWMPNHAALPHAPATACRGPPSTTAGAARRPRA